MPVERRVVAAVARKSATDSPIWEDDIVLRQDSLGRWRTDCGQSQDDVIQSLVEAAQRRGPYIDILVDGNLARWIFNGHEMPLEPVEFREGPDGKHRPRLEEWAMA